VTILHQQLLLVICQMWPLVVPLLERMLYDYLRQKYRQHWLVQLDQALNLTALEQGCAGYHLGSGKGSEVTHPVPRLVRALLVKYLFNLSYRQTEEKIDRDVLVKSFVGYGLFQSPPDHSTLQRFEIWVLNHQNELFFNEILGQIDRLDPGDGRKLQLVDSFAMLARAAKAGLISLIRDACRQVLSALNAIDPERQAAVLAGLNEVALFGQKGDKPTRALNAEERTQRLQQVVTEALRLRRLGQASRYQPPLPAPELEARLSHWLSVLDKIIQDEIDLTLAGSPDLGAVPLPLTPLEPTRSADLEELPEPPTPAEATAPLSLAEWLQQGGELRLKERPLGKKGPYRLGAITDTETTFRHHGADKGESAKLAYNCSLLTGQRYVRRTQADTGGRPDGEALPELLQAQAQQQGFFPPKVGGDQAYGAGKVRARVDQVSQGQTQVVALVPDYEKRSDRFSPAKFSLSADGKTLTCPNGVVSDTCYDRPQAGGREFRYTPGQCRGCAFFEACRGQAAKPTARRKVFISYHRDYTLAALAYNKTDQFKLEIKQRPLIERLIYNLTNLHGARKAHSTGLKKADFQLAMCATAFNIRQLLRRWPKLKLKLAAA